MTTETIKREQPETKETKEVTFECRYCGITWSLSEMRTLTRFFPPIVACKDCARKLQ